MQITWLPQRRDYYIAYAVTIVIGWLLTQPSESRGRRWIHIFVSVGVVHFGLYALSAFQAVRKPDFVGIDDSEGYIKSVSIFLLVAGALAVIWTGCLADLGALVFQFLLDSPDNRSLPQERIERAFVLLNAGKKWRARRVAGICIREDRSNLNTRLAAARLFMLAGSPWRARWHCYYILLKRRSSPAYRFGARHLLDEIRTNHPSRVESLLLRKPQKIRLR
jgi:hypothetical protein